MKGLPCNHAHGLQIAYHLLQRMGSRFSMQVPGKESVSIMGMCHDHVICCSLRCCKKFSKGWQCSSQPSQAVTIHRWHEWRHTLASSTMVSSGSSQL